MYYQEITLLPNAEIPCHFLWQKLFQQVHLALAENKATKTIIKDGKETVEEYSEYGLSFPRYDAQMNVLGNKLRIFGDTKERLEQLNLLRWLERLQDYCRCSSIENVPEKVEYACFKRMQFTNNQEKLARRRIKRLAKQGKRETPEQALAYYSGLSEEKTRLPFIYMESQTSKQRFPLFIERKLIPWPVKGVFSCYGLSKTATVPWF